MARVVLDNRPMLCQAPLCESSRPDPGKALTIFREPKPAFDPAALALSALGWVMADDIRAERFLSLTGLTPDTLRAGLMQRSVQCAVLEFLTAHEPSLIAAADALDVPPQALVAARNALGGEDFL
jgi:hypothetical protein